MALRRVFTVVARPGRMSRACAPVVPSAPFHGAPTAFQETEKALQEAQQLNMATMSFKDVKKALQAIEDDEPERTTISIDFAVEKDVLIAQIPVVPTAAEADELSSYLAREKHKKDFKDLESIERLFFFHVVNGDTNKAMIDYYDYKFHLTPTKLMCQLMMLQCGLQKDHKTLNNVFTDINTIKYLKWSKVALTVGIKAFAQHGDVNRMLQCYYKLYEFGHLPERVHWECVLKGAARAGDYRTFSRFYHRLAYKGVNAKRLLPSLFSEWGANENFEWKLSKECNTQLYDVAFAMTIALEVRNYRRALQFIDDLVKMNVKVTPQIYEAPQTLLKKVRKHFPELDADARQWLLRLKGDFKPLDDEVDKEMRAFVKRIREYIGEDKLENAPIGPSVPKPPRRISRKQARILNGKLDSKKLTQRYTSRYTDDSKLFEYVPDFERRLANLKTGETKKVVEAEIKSEIDAEIEAARRRFAVWKDVGFEGDFSLAAPGADRKKGEADQIEEDDFAAEEKELAAADSKKRRSRQGDREGRQPRGRGVSRRDGDE